MKNSTPLNDIPDDDDIAQVFASQPINIPDALRTSIAEQAEAATTRSNVSMTQRFAIAATFLLAAIITPMMLKPPESSLESASSEMMRLEETTSADSVQSFTTAGAEKNQALTSASPLNRQREINTEPSLSYRESPDKWINEIKVLIASANEQKAREEYLLFAQQYPTEAKTFKPDFGRQIIDDQEPASGRGPE